MPKNRPLLALTVSLILPLWALAQAPNPAPTPSLNPTVKAEAEAPPTEAEKTIDAAIEKLKALQSVSAEIKQDVKLLGLKFQVEGQYLYAPNHRIKLRLDVVGLGDVSGTMQQISDGETLWDFRRIVLDSASQGDLQRNPTDLRKRSLPPILEKLNSPDADSEIKEQVLAMLGLSRPEALLVGLRQAVSFDQKEEGESEGHKVWVIRGRWKDRTGLTGPNQMPIPATAPLPPHVPSLAEVWIDQESGWPRRMKLTGRAPSVLESRPEPRMLDQTGRPVGRAVTAPKVEPSEILLVYERLELNPQLDPIQFSFAPPQGAGIQVIDETLDITTNLTTLLAQRAAAKRAEAAKNNPELPKAITIPTIPGGVAPNPTPEPPVTAPPPKP